MSLLAVNGWHHVGARTELAIVHGKPWRIRTERRNLDFAIDEAAEYFAAPLRQVMDWEESDDIAGHEAQVEEDLP